MSATLDDADFRSPYGRELSKILRHGVGIHHVGLLPKYRLLVEKLTARSLLKVGLDLPLCKFHNPRSYRS